MSRSKHAAQDLLADPLFLNASLAFRALLPLAFLFSQGCLYVAQRKSRGIVSELVRVVALCLLQMNCFTTQAGLCK